MVESLRGFVGKASTLRPPEHPPITIGGGAGWYVDVVLTPESQANGVTIGVGSYIWRASEVVLKDEAKASRATISLRDGRMDASVESPERTDLLKLLAEISGSVAPETWERLPTDGSVRVDQIAYGKATK